MDKNIGEQLNKAFDAYRQVCVERDNIKKTLEQRISALEQTLEKKQTVIAKLQSQVASTTPRGNLPGQVQALETFPQVTEGDLLKVRRNEAPHPAASESLEDLKVALERERLSKESLLTTKNRLMDQIKDYQQKQTELKNDIEEKDRQLWQLRKEIKEYTELQPHCRPVLEVNWELTESPLKKDIPLTGTDHHALCKERMEFAFQEIYQEFKHLSALTKKQTELLSKYNYNKEVINMPFSMPIQCTDEGEQEHLVKTNVKEGSISKDFVASQGYRVQQGQLPVVESLSELDIKFPPSDNYEFLNSAPEKSKLKLPVEVPTCNVEEVLLKDDIQDLSKKCNKEEWTSFEICNAGSINEESNNLFCGEQGKCANINIERTPFRNPSSPTAHKPSNPFLNVEESAIKFPATEIRGPQQPVWSPYHNKEGELLHQASNDSDLDLRSKICEFCQAVFPAGSRSRENFLRHLNSHFDLPAKNGF
ncbi:TRAF family member-associated NF-kappa-B activator-like isoform X1 [Hypanus sabinus]|uniref:TRAF family member-associated NF-kappa-B activator-like isoform X1 n=1 Tax=Hypanus sabinus TaxID=79690 RepID=UPI0028C4212C|nr:TRAF family member-associated NF-kappa-B activator-like isoform X1 [Hypanus sabinus]XP_059822441.1 TRAF family member-associated NF-kappa-B activator-like isoform X1 [Hypanus sabinus]